MVLENKKTTAGGLFVTSGLGGMSGAQPKAGNIACITVCAEVNPKYTFVTAKAGSTKSSKILMN
jgi:urocanate hydratase